MEDDDFGTLKVGASNCHPPTAKSSFLWSGLPKGGSFPKSGDPNRDPKIL